MTLPIPNEDGVRLVVDPVSKADLKQMASERFGDMVKAVVDVERKIMAMGGDLHADEEKELLEGESRQANIWGINIYPDETVGRRIEFDSMINIRPKQNNRSRNVEDKITREQIIDIVNRLIIW